MALNGTRLGDAITNAVMATQGGSGVDPSEEARMRGFWRVVAQQIVSEITGNAVTSKDQERIS